MKKLIAIIVSLLMVSSVYADDIAKLNIKIADPIKENKYFLCLYGVGCMSITAGDKGKQFVMPAMDVGNIEKVVITDVANNMEMYFQASTPSCNVQVKANQTLTVSGQLVVKNNTPHINNLRCAVA